MTGLKNLHPGAIGKVNKNMNMLCVCPAARSQINMFVGVPAVSSIVNSYVTGVIFIMEPLGSQQKHEYVFRLPSAKKSDS